LDFPKTPPIEFAPSFCAQHGTTYGISVPKEILPFFFDGKDTPNVQTLSRNGTQH